VSRDLSSRTVVVPYQHIGHLLTCCGRRGTLDSLELYAGLYQFSFLLYSSSSSLLGSDDGPGGDDLRDLQDETRDWGRGRVYILYAITDVNTIQTVVIHDTIHQSISTPTRYFLAQARSSPPTCHERLASTRLRLQNLQLGDQIGLSGLLRVDVGIPHRAQSLFPSCRSLVTIKNPSRYQDPSR
jgi:hypothetical protein